MKTLEEAIEKYEYYLNEIYEDDAKTRKDTLIKGFFDEYFWLKQQVYRLLVNYPDNLTKEFREICNDDRVPIVPNNSKAMILTGQCLKFLKQVQTDYKKAEIN